MHRLRDGLAVVLFAFIFLLAAPPVHAAGLEDAIAHFTADDYSETDAGISAVAESGDPRAATIIEALQDGRLLFSAEQKKVFYKDADGKLFDAVTGAAADGAPPADLDDRAHQQPAAARDRCRPRRPDADVARSGQAL